MQKTLGQVQAANHGASTDPQATIPSQQVEQPVQKNNNPDPLVSPFVFQDEQPDSSQTSSDLLKDFTTKFSLLHVGVLLILGSILWFLFKR
jgi:hypothetical protein